MLMAGNKAPTLDDPGFMRSLLYMMKLHAELLVLLVIVTSATGEQVSLVFVVFFP